MIIFGSSLGHIHACNYEFYLALRFAIGSMHPDLVHKLNVLHSYHENTLVFTRKGKGLGCENI